jgi:hypothetical protein
MLEALDTGAVWSIARGLARNVDDYKAHLAACDQTRRNDLDGRGHLSEENLAEFTRFFLTVCLDQVAFMERLMQPDQLRARILLWAEGEIRLNELPPKSGAILEAVLYRGELPRAETANIIGTGDRPARRVVSALSDRAVLVSARLRGHLLRLALRNGRVLQLDLVGEIVERGLCAGNAGLGLRDLGFVVGRIDLNQQIACLDALKILDGDGEDLTGDRQARRVVSALSDRGVLVSESTRAPLRLAFPAALASRWMPGLFPERTG